MGTVDITKREEERKGGVEKVDEGGRREPMIGGLSI